MSRYYRKIIRIRAEDSPNVRWGLEQRSRGLEPTGEVLLPGVLPWIDYAKRRVTWDKVRQCIGLDAEFYEGAENLLFPPDWLNAAARRAEELRYVARTAIAIGVDPGEGGAETTMAAVDKRGLIELVAKKTPDTSVITSELLAFAKKHSVPSHKVYMDRGGGGKQHADRLRSMGYEVVTVAFGEVPSLEIRYSRYPVSDRREQQEEKYAYVNRRAEMYGLLRSKLDPAANPEGFALPADYTELRRQLAPIPLTYDPEGRLYLLPKDKKDPQSKQKTLKELLGCSPDQADALVLAVWGSEHVGTRRKVGAIHERG
jgi:hypothetical protein